MIQIFVKKTSVLSMLYIMNLLVNNVGTEFILAKINSEEYDVTEEADPISPADNLRETNSSVN